MMYTVWLCKSPSSGEEALVVRSMQVDDYRYEHYFQRIAYRGAADNALDALAKARA